MMVPAETTPVLVGAAQITAREPDPERTPIGLIAEAARAAAADCGVTGVLGQVQSLTCLNILAPAYPDAPASLTQRLGIEPGERFYTPIGGNMGQWLVGYYADRTATGLVSGVGWYMSKHSLGLYGGRPPTGGWRPSDTSGLQAEIDAGSMVDVVEQAQGKGRMETYTVMHDRADRPVQGIVLGRLGDGRRFVANTPTDTDLLDAMTNEEFLDRTGRVHIDGKRNPFVPDG